MGLVLNRPSDAAVADAVPDLAWVDRRRRHRVRRRPGRAQRRDRPGRVDDPAHAVVLVEDDLGFVPGDARTPTRWRRRSAARASTPATPAGAPASSRPSSRRRRGSSRRRSARSCSAPSRRGSGRRCCAGWARVRAALDDAARPVAELSTPASVRGRTCRPRRCAAGERIGPVSPDELSRPRTTLRRILGTGTERGHPGQQTGHVSAARSSRAVARRSLAYSSSGSPGPPTRSRATATRGRAAMGRPACAAAARVDLPNLLVWEELDSRITPADEFFAVSHYGRPDRAATTGGSPSPAWSSTR